MIFEKLCRSCVHHKAGKCYRKATIQRDRVQGRKYITNLLEPEQERKMGIIRAIINSRCGKRGRYHVIRED